MGFRRAKEMTTISNPSEKEPLACVVYLCKYNIQQQLSKNSFRQSPGDFHAPFMTVTSIVSCVKIPYFINLAHDPTLTFPEVLCVIWRDKKLISHSEIQCLGLCDVLAWAG